MKPEPVPDKNSKNVKEIIIPPEKRERRKNYEMEHYKISKLLSNSKFVAKKWIEVKDLSGSQYSAKRI